MLFLPPGAARPGSRRGCRNGEAVVAKAGRDRRHNVLADPGRLADKLDADEVDDLRAERDRQTVDGDVADGETLPRRHLVDGAQPVSTIAAHDLPKVLWVGAVRR